MGWMSHLRQARRAFGIIEDVGARACTTAGSALQLLASILEVLIPFLALAWLCGILCMEPHSNISHQHLKEDLKGFALYSL